MSRRTKIIITVLIIAAVIFALVFLALWFLNRNQGAPAQAPEDDISIQVPTTLPTASAGRTLEEDMPTERKNLEADLKAIAMTFAERFGSYSNESNFANARTLFDLMTDRMQASVESSIINQQSVSGGNEVYYGVTTKAIAAKVLELDEANGNATLTIQTQRQEARLSTQNPDIFYQNLRLELVKTDSGWKIDAAAWE